jgi:filamentous hemagglutinin family protein
MSDFSMVIRRPARRGPHRLFDYVRVRVSRKRWATYRVRLRQGVSRALALLLLAIGLPALAAPAGGRVVGGQAEINTLPGTTLVRQFTPKTSIDWQSFNVASGETVRFLQPSSSAVALNRVLGGDPSQIMGTITANGKVFLLNSQGVYFGPGAHVDTGGLVASTLALSDADFATGLYRFSGTSTATVRNDGHITATPGGYVVLAGAHVDNQGTIVADGGSVALAAGSRVALDLQGDRLVSFSIDGAALRASVENAGLVQADGGSVSMMANAVGGALATAVNQSGVIRANSVSEHDGIVSLRAIGGDTVVTGVIDVSGRASGQTGGTVQVLGDRVGLFDAASIDASGAAGGGTVQVGGDFHGQGGVPTASRTVVAPGVLIAADAIERGNGGKVAVWSDDDTSFNGRIEARGGAAGGDGGFVETSGRQILSVLVGDVNAGSVSGRNGTWLLDPNDLTIENNDGRNVNMKGFVTTGDSAILDTGVLSRALSNASNVVVRTASQDTSRQHGDIHVRDTTTANLQKDQSATLTLDAQGNIYFDAGATITAGAVDRSLSVILNAGTNADGSGAGTHASLISMDPTSSIDAGLAGNVSATARGTIALANITTRGAGALTVTSNGGDISDAAALHVGGLAKFIAGTGDVGLDAPGDQFGSLSFTARDVNVTTPGGISFAGSTITGDLDASAGGIIRTLVGGGIRVDGNTALNAGANAIQMTDGLDRFGGYVSASNTGTANGIVLRDATAMQLGAVSTQGNLSVQSGGDVTQSGALSVFGTSLFAIDAGGQGRNFLLNGAFDNRLKGLVTFGTIGSVVTVQGIHLRNGDPNASMPAWLPGKAGLAYAALDLDYTDVASQVHLPAGLDLASTLDVVAGHLIDETGAVTVHGATHLDAPTINLPNAGNAFFGDVSLAWTGTDATLTNNRMLTAHLDGTGKATLAATGDVDVDGSAGTLLVARSQDAHSSAGTTTTTLAAAGDASNSGTVAGALSISAGGDGSNSGGVGSATITAGGNGSNSGTVGTTLTITAKGDVLNTRTVGGDALLTSTNHGAVTNTGEVIGNAKLATAGGAVTNSGRVHQSLTTSGGPTVLSNEVNALAVNATGPVSQPVGSFLKVDTTTSIQAPGQSVTLANTGNDFVGAVTSVSADGLTLHDANDLEVDAMQHQGDGAVVLSASRLVLPQGLDAGAGDLTLASTGLLTTTGALAGNDVVLSGLAGVTLHGNVTAHGALQIASGDGNVSQEAGIVEADGLTHVSAAGDVALQALANDFRSTVVVDGANVTLTNANDLAVEGSAQTLLARSVAGNASSGVATRGDSTVRAAGDAGNHGHVGGNLTLEDGTSATNSGQVDHDATLHASGAVANTGSIGGAAELQSSGNGAVTNSGDVAGALDTQGGATRISGHVGSLTVVADGDVSQPDASALVVDGATRITASGHSVTLANADNDFRGLVTLAGDTQADGTGQAITLHDLNALALGEVDLARNESLSLSAGGNLTLQAQALDAGSGRLDFSSGGAFATAGTLQAADIAIHGAGGVTLAHDVVASHDLTITTADATIDQVAGHVDVAGVTTLQAGRGQVTLDEIDNRFGGAVSVAAGSASLATSGALALDATVPGALAVQAAATTIAGDVGSLSLSAHGDVQQAGGATLVVHGPTDIYAQGHDVRLGNAGNDFQDPVVVNAADATLSDRDALALGAMNVTGALAVTAGGAITQSGALAVGGASTFDAGPFAVVLDAAGNRLLGPISSLGSGAVAIENAAPATVLGTIGSAQAPAASLTVVSNGGDISQATGAAAFVAGAVDVDAGTGTIAMGNTGNMLATGTGVQGADSAGEAVAKFVGSDLVYFDNPGKDGVARVDFSHVTGDATLTTSGRVIELYGESFDGTSLKFSSTADDLFLKNATPNLFRLNANVKSVDMATRQDPLSVFQLVNGDTTVGGLVFSALAQVHTIAIGGTTATVTDEDRRERERAAGYGRIRQGIRLNTIGFEEMVAPLQYQQFEAAHAPCAREQAEGLDDTTCEGPTP